MGLAERAESLAEEAARGVFRTAKGALLRRRPSIQPVGAIPYSGLPGINDRIAYIARATVGHRRVNIVGQSGSGKSSAAFGYFDRSTRYRYKLWVSFGAEGASRADMRSALSLMGRDLPESALPEVLSSTLSHTLGRTKGYLIVLDGANDPREILELLPDGVPRRSAILLTSVSPAYSEIGFLNVQLPDLSRGECIRYLSRASPGPTDPVSLGDLVDAVGALPLAIKQIGSMIARPSMSPSALADKIATEGASGILHNSSATERHPSVIESFIAAMNDAMLNNSNAERVLYTIGQFAINDVSLDLLPAATNLSGMEVESAVNALRNVSLVSVTAPITGAGAPSARVHPLTRSIARDVLSADRVAVLRGIVVALATKVPARSWDPECWAAVEAIRPHAREVLQSTDELGPHQNRSLRDVSRALGRYEWSTGKYDQAAIDFAIALDAAGSLPQPRTAADDGIVASLRNDRAITLSSLGNPRAALELHGEAASLWRALGPQYVNDVLWATTGEACVLRDFGLTLDASAALESEMRWRSSVALPWAPEETWALCALATMFGERGEVLLGLSLAEEMLTVRLTQLGYVHIDVARSYFTLSRLARYDSDYPRSYEWAKKCIQVRETILGRSHPLTLRAILAAAVARLGMDDKRGGRRLFTDAVSRGLHRLSDVDRAKFSYWGAAFFAGDPAFTLEDAITRVRRVFGEDAPIVSQYETLPLSRPVSESKAL